MNKEKDNKVDRKDIIATIVAVFVATIIKHFIFTDSFVEYKLWKDVLIYMILFLPVYLFMLFIQGKFKKN